MWIVITAPFIDKQAEDPEDVNVPAGKKMNVTAERGKELIDLGLAEASDTDAAKPTKAEVKVGSNTISQAIAAAPHNPNSAASSGAEPIAPGESGPVDGHPAAEDTTHD